MAGGGRPSRDYEHGAGLEEFGYGEVQFEPGPQESQLEHIHRILMSLDDDSLLRPYRIAAGLSAPGKDLGGWYSEPRFLGETFGQWISALSRYHAAKGDEPTRVKIARLLDGFLETMNSERNIFIDHRNPLYFYDKTVLGLSDAFLALDAPRASRILSKFTDATSIILSQKARFLKDADRPEQPLDPIHWPVFNNAETYLLAWQRSGDRRYLERAILDVEEDDFLRQLSHGRNVLAGRHAYGHTNALCGAAKAYLALGDEKFLRAARNGFDFVQQQTYATGTYGAHESFLPRAAPSTYTGPKIVTVGDSVLADQLHFETGCGSYAHFKLTRYLLRITKDSRYGDSMERVMYNAALGVLPLTQFGDAFYQSNYHRYARKEYFDGYGHVMEDEWPCCSGTLGQLVADYRISTYFRDKRGVFVNLYIPSTLNWFQDGQRCSLKQSGSYPLTDTISLIVSTPQPSTFAMRLRIPAWAHSPVLRVNDTPVVTSLRPGSFAEVRRRWKQGDKVELTLPKVNQLVACDDQHPHLVALRCGPMVLFAIGHDLPKMSREMLLSVRQPQPGAAEWRAGGISFLPWWMIAGETYTTYHDVS